MFKFLSKFFDSNEQQIKALQKIVVIINELETDVKKLKAEQFLQKTVEFKKRLAEGETLDDILPEAYALGREAARRVLNERPFDVQLMSAIVLHQGKVAEQKTGEGKTLSASLPLFLNSLSGRGVHLVTVNDYLARVGTGWIGPVFHLLGVSTSAIIHDQSFIYDPLYEEKDAADWRLKHLRPINRKDAYKADVTYGVNSEFGFDYLRDNMVSDISQCSQREEHHFAIVDEVDSVLIDEARTPHIISAPDTEPTQKYYEISKLISRLDKQSDFVVDEKLRTAHLTEKGIQQVEQMLNISNLYEKDFHTVHLIEAALKAQVLFKREKDYIVRDNQVIIVDEFTGRLLQGRRFSEGLHQAIEAKEGVTIQQESKTLATVSLQNYFRMYEKLAGMTGTAVTEAEEFHKIYNLDVVVIPTHRQLLRIDYPDIVYKTTKGKFDAIVEEIINFHKKGQPILVGTTSIEKNELLSELLHRKKIPHELLNAKNHEKEAMIISQAGRKGAVTVATNMAGRGVDIILGGSAPSKSQITDSNDQKQFEKLFKEWKKEHEEVVQLGGLHVIGTERHESRRIDNQLRGRAGRQGDPGSSRFFVALDDDIMRLFGGDQVAKLMTFFKLPEDVPLEHGMVTKAIEQAQIKVEGFHFDSRKHLVEYDDVLNKQREIIYSRRRNLLTGGEIKEKILEGMEKEIQQIVVTYSLSKEGIEKEKIITEFVSIVPFDEPSQKQLVIQLEQRASSEEVAEFLLTLVKDLYQQRETQMGLDMMRQVERWVTLTTIDNLWMEHLDDIDTLREGIGLRGYAQRDPLVEYKNEAFSMFERLVSRIDYEVNRRIFRAQVNLASNIEPPKLETQPASQISQTSGNALDKLKILNSVPQKKTAGDLLSSLLKKDSRLVQASQNQINKAISSGMQTMGKTRLGRNDPCWCKSGRKWKKCHYPTGG